MKDKEPAKITNHNKSYFIGWEQSVIIFEVEDKRLSNLKMKASTHDTSDKMRN